MNTQSSHSENLPIISLVRSSRSLLHLKQIHCHLLRLHQLSGHSPAAAAIISSSSSLHCIPYALSFFHCLPPPPPSPHLFNSLIRALSDSSFFSSALSHLSLMLRLGLPAGRLSLPFASAPPPLSPPLPPPPPSTPPPPTIPDEHYNYNEPSKD